MKKRLTILMILLALAALALPVLAQDDVDPNRAKVIEIVAASEPFADWLDSWPDYVPEAWGPDENGVWYVEFYDAAHEEWLGYANIHGETYDLLDSFAPLPLPPDVYQEQLPRVMERVENDAEVLAWLGTSPDLWDVYAEWNRWDQRWEVAYYRGIQAVAAWVTMDETGDPQINDVVDPNALDDEEARNEARNAAINLAYSAPGIDAALAGHDSWTTYTQQQGSDDRWGVAFVDGDATLLFVLVDVAAGEIVSAE